MESADGNAKKRLNLSEKRALRAAEIVKFTQQYQRKAQRGVEPNDRRYDRKIEEAVKRMKPEDLDRLMRSDED